MHELELSGRPVGCVVVNEDEWVADQVARGAQEFMVRFLLGFCQTAQQGGFAGTDPLLGKLLDREPRTARDFLSEPAAG